ncbi:MAG: SDR family NAD(P)-dependent oxidoreductase [Verrucomicrobia bacterium]|nr:SDR family NAD(P)-dependent oxidoreductase [Verrucomicrobiota bacterium]
MKSAQIDAVYPDLKERSVVVTGGANGIGAAIVRAFHAQGARVSFCDLDSVAGAKLADELGENAVFRKVNLFRESEIVQWIKTIGTRESTIHTLVNNAAADTRIPFSETTAKEWDSLFARNLRAYFLTSRESVKWMPEGIGCIVNFASIVFHTGPVNLTAYTATKGGILGFTRSLARELGSKGIRVNAVSPGWVMTKRQIKDFVTPATKRLIRASQCVPELIQPEEIANVVLFLASHSSRVITGQEILADRGWAHG